MCTLAKTEIYAYSDFIKHLNTSTDGCNWEMATYYLDNYIPVVNTFPPFLKSGEYMVTFKVLKNGELINGYKTVFSYTKM